MVSCCMNVCLSLTLSVQFFDFYNHRTIQINEWHCKKAQNCRQSDNLQLQKSWLVHRADVLNAIQNESPSKPLLFFCPIYNKWHRMRFRIMGTRDYGLVNTSLSCLDDQQQHNQQKFFSATKSHFTSAAAALAASLIKLNRGSHYVF